jgi:hypothetical protein
MENDTPQQTEPRLFQKAEILFSHILVLEKEVEILDDAKLKDRWKEKSQELQELNQKFKNLFTKEAFL